MGLGKGKPYTVSSKVAKKKIGVYKMKGGFSPAGKLSFQKRQRTSFMEFGRKRGTKSKMRGVFGVPGLGLQRPQAPDIKNSTDDDPGKCYCNCDFIMLRNAMRRRIMYEPYVSSFKHLVPPSGGHVSRSGTL